MVNQLHNRVGFKVLLRMPCYFFISYVNMLKQIGYLAQ